MFCDETFHGQKLEKIGIEHRVLECSQQGDDFRIRVERKIPVKLPGMKKGGATSTVIHTECWNTKTRHGTVHVELPGMPLTMHCQSVAEDDGDGCVVRYDWEIKSRVPVVGGKIEKFVVADMDKQAEPERLAGVELLDNYRG